MRTKDMSEGFRARVGAGLLLVGAIALAAVLFVTAAVTARGQESEVPVAPAGKWQVTAHLVDSDGGVQAGYRYTPDGQLKDFDTEKECTDFVAGDASLAAAEKNLGDQLAAVIAKGQIPAGYKLTWQCEQLDKVPQTF